MLTLRKSDGAVSKAGDAPKKGSKGRHEWYAESTETGGFRLCFTDVGNYGKERWFARDPISEAQLEDMIGMLQALRDGRVSTTRIPFEENTTEAPAAPASASGEVSAVVPASDDDSEVAELTA